MAKCILHLEDDDVSARFIDAFLRSEGYEVIETRDPHEAKTILTQASNKGVPIDGLLADLKMRDPGSGTPDLEATEVGAWFLYWLRQQGPYGDLPIVVLSAHTEDKRMPGWKHLLKIREVVYKPANSRSLGTAIINTFGPA